mmetsp:Transcript_124706/g.311918  ORF Transcript_124706/g.311918 Transcript_124706/m.311918 type:complete len:252 (-) Transcript_124706:125-880(-)
MSPSTRCCEQRSVFACSIKSFSAFSSANCCVFFVRPIGGPRPNSSVSSRGSSPEPCRLPLLPVAWSMPPAAPLSSADAATAMSVLARAGVPGAGGCTAMAAMGSDGEPSGSNSKSSLQPEEGCEAGVSGTCCQGRRPASTAIGESNAGAWGCSACRSASKPSSSSDPSPAEPPSLPAQAPSAMPRAKKTLGAAAGRPVVDCFSSSTSSGMHINSLPPVSSSFRACANGGVATCWWPSCTHAKLGSPPWRSS